MKASLSRYLSGVFDIYKRWCTWQRFSTLFITVSALGILTTQTEIADSVMKGETGLTWQPWVATFSGVYAYTLISPFLIHCCEIWSLSKVNLIKTPIKLLVLYIPITLLFITVMLIFRNMAHIIIDGVPFDSWNLFDRYVYEFPKTVAVYWGFVFVTYTKIYYDSSKEEQLNAVNLENELQTIRMQTLRSQLQPNFLFNTLNLISTTVYQDSDKADSIITRLGDLLRYSLATEQKPFVTIKEELQAMQSYLEISQLRFGERITVDIDVEPTTELVLIPTMLLQPLLENSVKYGIELSDEAGKITLACNLIDGLVQIKITNPWHHSLNSQQQESFAIGLQSTKDRLKILYQEQAKVTLDNSDTDSVTLTIMLPAQQMEQINE
jgi:sensor histidine kinase YesM